MNKEKHIMVDIETLANCSNPVICSIGAVKFDINTGEKFETFYKIIDIQSCIDLGMRVMGSTIMWWLQQNEETRRELCSSNREPLEKALISFYTFCDKESFIWAESPRFDLGFLTDAYDNIKVNIPWDFRKERDVRTIVGESPEIKEKYLNKGIIHNALDDCLKQIDYLVETRNKVIKI